MQIQCPHCSESDNRTKLRQPFQFSLGFLVFALLGGGIGGIFWGLGQDSKFQCGRCSGVFFSHTPVSRVFFVFCITTYAAVAGFIAYGVWMTIRGA
jgi:hypothetical protein